ncbi:hypothetical protein ACX1NA_00075 [Mycoplasma sp. VS276A1]
MLQKLDDKKLNIAIIACITAALISLIIFLCLPLAFKAEAGPFGDFIPYKTLMETATFRAGAPADAYPAKYLAAAVFTIIFIITFTLSTASALGLTVLKFVRKQNN